MDTPQGKYEVQMIPMADIFHDWRFNCRGKISPMDVIDLAKDIKARGLDQPIVLAPYNKDGFKYKIVAGHRRHLAFQYNEATEIPAFIRNDLVDELAAHMLNFRENIHRSELNIKQEAHALKYFLDYKSSTTGRNLFTEVELAVMFGQSRGWVQNRKNLLKLPDDIQNEAVAGMISTDQINTLARMVDSSRKEELYELVRKIKERRLKGEKISLRPSITRVNDVLRPSDRDKQEIVEMNGLIYDIVGACLTTRFGAWCAGDISTSSFFGSLEEHCRANGIPFKMPKFVMDAIVGVRDNSQASLVVKTMKKI